MARSILILGLALAALPAHAQFVETRLVPRWDDGERRYELPREPLALREAAALLSRGAPYQVSYQGPPRKLALRVTGKRFWPAVLALCDQAGLDFVQWDRPRITLSPGPFRLASMARVGPYLAVLRAPVRLHDGTWQFTLTLDRLQLPPDDLPLALEATRFLLGPVELEPVLRREAGRRTELVFQTRAPREARLAGLLRLRWPSSLRSGNVPLSGSATDAGLVFRAGQPEPVFGGWRLQLEAAGEARRDRVLKRALLLGAGGKQVAAELSSGGPQRWTLRFPELLGPSALRIEYYTGYQRRELPLALDGPRFAGPAPPARRVAGRIRILAPPPGPGRLTVGFRGAGEAHGTVDAALDLATLAHQPASLRESGPDGHLEWAGVDVRYALDRLRPGAHQIWVRYRRNLIAVSRVIVPERGAVALDFTLDCRRTVELRARVEGAPSHASRLFLIPLDEAGRPALDNHRDAIAGRIERDGSVVLPLLGLGRYRVLALDEDAPGRPLLLAPSFVVDRAGRATWKLPRE